MFKRIHFIVVASLMAAGLAACSAHVDGGSVPLPIVSSSNPPASSAPATVLEGNWSSGCAGSNGFYMSATFGFAGNSMAGTIKIYGDAQCTQLVQQQTQTGTFSIGGPAAVSGATNINYVSSNGQATYDIFEINQSGTLYFGNSPGTSQASRSNALNTDLPLTKVRTN